MNIFEKFKYWLNEGAHPHPKLFPKIEIDDVISFKFAGFYAEGVVISIHTNDDIIIKMTKHNYDNNLMSGCIVTKTKIILKKTVIL